MSLGLFAGYGIELEYMIVDRESLAIRPVCDQILHEVAGAYVNEVEAGSLRWSNELALHVVELKTNGPAPAIDPLAPAFAAGVKALDGLLAPYNAMLLPTAMHPTMNPAEAKLWPHDGRPIYATYDRVFGTGGHGWVNLQSMHVNLPFCGDAEFGRLHGAVRAVLPILSGLAASSPFVEGRVAGPLDMRLEVYRTNQRKIPSIIGQVVPEPVWTEEAYRRDILQPMYDDIAPMDPDGELQDEWLNSRGAIARFDRNAIEIRLLDLQECPRADLAVARLVSETVRALCDERYVGLAELQSLATEDLARQFVAGVGPADLATVDHVPLLRALGATADRLTVRALWAELLERLWPQSDAPLAPEEDLRGAAGVIVEHGCLARRILAATGPAPDRDGIHRVYRELADCLLSGRSFLG